MPKKVILHGDALKLLYTFLDYAEGHASRNHLAQAMNYDLQAFQQRAAMLRQQLNDGCCVEWDNLETALAAQAGEREAV